MLWHSLYCTISASQSIILGHWLYFLSQIFSLHHFPGKPIRLAGVSDTPQFTTLPGHHSQIQAHVLETHICLSSGLYCWIGWILVWVLVLLEWSQFFELRSCYAAQARLKLMVFQPLLPLSYWDYRCILLHPAVPS